MLPNVVGENEKGVLPAAELVKKQVSNPPGNEGFTWGRQPQHPPEYKDKPLDKYYVTEDKKYGKPTMLYVMEHSDRKYAASFNSQDRRFKELDALAKADNQLGPGTYDMPPTIGVKTQADDLPVQERDRPAEPQGHQGRGAVHRHRRALRAAGAGVDVEGLRVLDARAIPARAQAVEGLARSSVYGR